MSEQHIIQLYGKSLTTCKLQQSNGMEHFVGIFVAYSQIELKMIHLRGH